MTVHCRYCKKELEVSQAVAVYRNGRSVYYCREHANRNTDKQWFMEILKDALDLPVLTKADYAPVTDHVRKYGFETCGHYLCDNARRIRSRLNGKAERGELHGANARSKILAKIMSDELPNYRKGPIKAPAVMLKPEREIAHTIHIPKETLEEKHARLKAMTLLAMQESDDEQS